MLNIILGSTVPVFFVMAVGYLAGWTRDIDNHHVAEVNALVMDFALPAALFVAMVRTPRAQLLQQRVLMAVLVVTMLAIYGLVFVLQRRVFKSESREAAVISLTTAFPNLASAGLPVISSVFGAGHTVSVGISIAVGAIVLSPVTLVILEAGEKATQDVPAVRRIIRAIGRSIFTSPRSRRHDSRQQLCASRAREVRRVVYRELWVVGAKGKQGLPAVGSNDTPAEGGGGLSGFLLKAEH